MFKVRGPHSETYRNMPFPRDTERLCNAAMLRGPVPPSACECGNPTSICSAQNAARGLEGRSTVPDPRSHGPETSSKLTHKACLYHTGLFIYLLIIIYMQLFGYLVELLLKVISRKFFITWRRSANCLQHIRKTSRNKANILQAVLSYKTQICAYLVKIWAYVGRSSNNPLMVVGFPHTMPSSLSCHQFSHALFFAVQHGRFIQSQFKPLTGIWNHLSTTFSLVIVEIQPTQNIQHIMQWKLPMRHEVVVWWKDFAVWHAVEIGLQWNILKYWPLDVSEEMARGNSWQPRAI